MMTNGVTIPRIVLGRKKRVLVRKMMRSTMGNDSKVAETTSTKGSTLRLVMPAASKIKPSVVGEGKRSATRPPR